jgi:hypothetical protein
MVFQSSVFDTNATRAMGEAFDRACDILHDLGQPDLIREIIGRRIVEVARDGERDPNELCAQALKALGFSIPPNCLNPRRLMPPQLTAAEPGIPTIVGDGQLSFGTGTPVTAHAASFRDRTARAS